MTTDTKQPIHPAVPFSQTTGNIAQAHLALNRAALKLMRERGLMAAALFPVTR
jgi:hypothetical protein